MTALAIFERVALAGYDRFGRELQRQPGNLAKSL